jgi:glutaredoxin 3
MTLDLYHLQGCPYCRKVRDYIESQGLRPEVRYHEVSEEDGARDLVVSLTGNTQVPVLVIDGNRPVANSNTIIEWLGTHCVHPVPGRQRDDAAAANRTR